MVLMYHLMTLTINFNDRFSFWTFRFSQLSLAPICIFTVGINPINNVIPFWIICLTISLSTLKTWSRQRLRWNYGTIVTLIKHVDAFSAKNEVWKKLFILTWFDMFFIDVFSLGLKVNAIMYILLNGIGQSPQYVIAFIIVLYFFNEFIKIGATYLFSPRKNVVRYVRLIPFTVIIYRPLFLCTVICLFCCSIQDRSQVVGIQIPQFQLEDCIFQMRTDGYVRNG